MQKIGHGDRITIYVSRNKAMTFADNGGIDHEAKKSIFGQVVREMENRCPSMSCFRMHSTDDQCWRVNFKGEGSDDYGGPFRDCLVNIANEMESGVVPLFIKSPNNRMEHGTYRDCYILNGKSKSPSHLLMLKYLGGLIGFAILSKSPIPFNFAPIVWKQIIGDTPDIMDLHAIDAYSVQVIQDLQKYSAQLTDEEFGYTIDQNFTTVLSNGDEVLLCPNGAQKQVTKENMNEFIKLVLAARFSEAKE